MNLSATALRKLIIIILPLVTLVFVTAISAAPASLRRCPQVFDAKGDSAYLELEAQLYASFTGALTRSTIRDGLAFLNDERHFNAGTLGAFRILGNLILDQTMLNQPMDVATEKLVIPPEDIQQYSPSVTSYMILIRKLLEAYYSGAPRGNQFFYLLGRYYSPYFEETLRDIYGSEFSQPVPLPSPEVPGEYWDLASGPLAMRIMGSLPSDRPVKLIDRSFYVKGLLESFVTRHDYEHVEVVQQKLAGLSRPPKGLAAIRAKDVMSYANGFARQLRTVVLDWVNPAGSVYLMMDPAMKFGVPSSWKWGLMLEQYEGPLKKVLSEQWAWESVFGRRYHFDCLSLTKPSEPQRVLDPEYADQQFEQIRDSWSDWYRQSIRDFGG